MQVSNDTPASAVGEMKVWSRDVSDNSTLATVSWSLQLTYSLSIPILEGSYDLPAVMTCGATVPDIDLGSIYPGETTNARATAQITGTGKSKLELSGGLDDAGTLHLSDHVSVSPYYSVSFADGAWRFDTSSTMGPSLPLVLKADSTAPAGPVSATMTAKLTCQ